MMKVHVAVSRYLLIWLVELDREGAAGHARSEGEFLRDPEGKVLRRTDRH